MLNVEWRNEAQLIKISAQAKQDSLTMVIEAEGDRECTLDVSETSSERLSLYRDRSRDRSLS